MRKLFTLAILIGAAPFLTADGNHGSVTATVGVNLYAPVKISKVQDLSFGAVVVNDTSSPLGLVMAADGTVTYTNGVALIGTKALAPAPAKFGFTKDSTLAVSLNIPASIQLAPGVKWTVASTVTGDAVNSTVGSVVLYGTLAADAGKTGTFSQDFSVTVNYN